MMQSILYNATHCSGFLESVLGIYLARLCAEEIEIFLQNVMHRYRCHHAAELIDDVRRCISRFRRIVSRVMLINS